MNRERVWQGLRKFFVKNKPFWNVALVIIVFILVFVDYHSWSKVNSTTVQEGSTTTWLAGFYGNLDEDDDCLVTNDGEFLQYCLEKFPESFFKESAWDTYEDAVSVYASNPDEWGTVELIGGRDVMVAWRKWRFGWNCYMIVPDQMPCWMDDGFNLGSGWLYVNGIRVMAYDQTVVSMDPAEIIKLYQYGDWDGRGILRSADGGTMATNDSGRIKYTYKAELYPEGTHGVVAYNGYEDPWWIDINATWADRIIESNYEEADDYAMGFCETDCYLDLPIDYSPENIYFAEWYTNKYIVNSDESGAFFLTDDGVMQYSRGELLEKWNFSVFPEGVEDAFIMSVRSQHGYLAYVYNGRQLIGLKVHGAYDVLMDRVVNRVGYKWYDSLFGLLDGNLVYWHYDDYIVLAEDVIDADFTDVKIFEKSDGCYAIVAEDVYSKILYEDTWEMVYLGVGSIEEYLKVYNSLDAGCYID